MSIATDGGKWWAIFHIVVSVSLLGDLIGTVEELREERKALLAKVEQLNRPFDKPLLDDLMACAVKVRTPRACRGRRTAHGLPRNSVDCWDQLPQPATYATHPRWQLRPNLTRDGKGLTELEFVLGMMIELGIVEWGKVRPFIAEFRSFDVDGTGRLGQDDLDMMARGEPRMKATMNVASRSPAFGSANACNVLLSVSPSSPAQAGPAP